MLKKLWNLLVAFLVMVLLLLVVALAGGVGTVELTLWLLLTAIVLTVVGIGQDRRDGLVRASARAFRREQHANN